VPGDHDSHAGREECESLARCGVWRRRLLVPEAFVLGLVPGYAVRFMSLLEP